MPKWIAGSKKQQEENNKLFSEVIIQEFLDFIFLKFCKVEEIKEFVKKYVIGKEANEVASKLVEEKRPESYVAPELERKSWVEKWGAVFNKFMDTITEAANQAVQGAKQVVNQLLPSKLQPQIQPIVINMFQPKHAVPHVQQIMNGFQQNQLNLVHQFKSRCPQHMRNHYDVRLLKLQGAIRKFQEGGNSNSAHLKGVLHQTMRMSMFIRFLDDTSNLKLAQHDARHVENLYPHLRDHQKTFAGAFAAAGATMMNATKELGRDFKGGLEDASLFNPSPLRTTPNPFDRH